MISHVQKLATNYFSHYIGLPKLAWNGIILNFIESVFLGVYYFLPIYFINSLQFSIITAGTMVSCFGFGTIVGGYISGMLSDRYGSETVSITSLALQSIVFILLTGLTSQILLSIDLFIMGFFSYAFITANHLWVLEKCHCENERLKALNILSAGSNLGLSISALIIGILAPYGFKLIFMLSSLFLIALAIHFLILLSKNSNNHAHLNQVIKSTSNVITNLNTTTYLVLICLFLMGFIIFQTSTTYSLFLQNMFPELGIRALSILFSINSLIVVFFQTPIVNLFCNFNKILLMGTGAFLIGLGMVLLNFSNLFFIAIISCITYTVGEMLFFSIAQLICYQNGGHNKKGKAMGLYRMIYATSRVVAPTIGTIIFAQLGAQTLWYLCGLLGIVCLTWCAYHAKSKLDFHLC